jgi:hypothetical protein
MGMYPKECKSMIRDTCTPVFTATLFTIVKLWNQPKCPQTNELMKKMCYISTMDYYSALKRNEITLFARK